jgi:predicted RNA-binding protein with TRAM domain
MDEPTADEPDAATEAASTAADRSPSIDDFAATIERSGDGSDGTATVTWAVDDPDGDLKTVGIRVAAVSGDDARVAASRTVAIDGSEAGDEVAPDSTTSSRGRPTRFGSGSRTGPATSRSR